MNTMKHLLFGLLVLLVFATPVAAASGPNECDWFANSPQTLSSYLVYDGSWGGYDMYHIVGSGVGALFYRGKCPQNITDMRSFLVKRGSYNYYRIRAMINGSLIVTPLRAMPTPSYRYR